MNRTQYRRRQHVRLPVPSPGSTPHRRRALNGRPVIRPTPITLHASTASADQAATDSLNGRQGVAQTSATGCRQCGNALPKWSRQHLNRCRNVRCICSTGLPKAGRWSKSCPDWRCKNGYRHTIVIHFVRRLDLRNPLAKGTPLWNPRRDLPRSYLLWRSPACLVPR
jgi:hypothetical protein